MHAPLPHCSCASAHKVKQCISRASVSLICPAMVFVAGSGSRCCTFAAGAVAEVVCGMHVDESSRASGEAPGCPVQGSNHGGSGGWPRLTDCKEPVSSASTAAHATCALLLSAVTYPRLYGHLSFQMSEITSCMYLLRQSNFCAKITK